MHVPVEFIAAANAAAAAAAAAADVAENGWIDMGMSAPSGIPVGFGPDGGGAMRVGVSVAVAAATAAAAVPSCAVTTGNAGVGGCAGGCMMTRFMAGAVLVVSGVASAGGATTGVGAVVTASVLMAGENKTGSYVCTNTCA